MGVYAMTGGATGIGAALKDQLRERGDSVIVVDIKAADVVADLSTDEGRLAAIDGVRALAPDGLDGFIPCAGLGSHIKPASLIAQVNYFAVIATIEGLRDLVARKNGSILLVSSNSAPMIENDNPYVAACMADEDEATALALVTDGHTAYAGSKRGITLWMRRNVAAYAADGVRMNAVAPGITMTNMTEEISKDEQFGEAIKQFAEMTPVGGSAQPEQIASAMCFLLSQEASFICGSVLFVDGGTDAMIRPDAF
jgi:NAD(P)-dependent dehydrogenase (short-subunit alcohol dehydrogenase family)